MGGVLLISQKLNESRGPLPALPLKILDNVFSSGGGVGIAASSHRGSNLKGL